MNSDNSVALGASSIANGIHSGAYTLNGGTPAGISNAANGVVSVGSAGHERQIQNVAAGVVSATSTDAVNGSQLYAVGAAVNNLGASTVAALGTGTYDPSTGNITGVGYQVGGLTYNSVAGAIGALQSYNPGGYFAATGISFASAAGENSTAMGSGALAEGAFSLAAGSGASATGDNSPALGSGTTANAINSTAVGYNATAAGVNSLALGANSNATTANSVALGANSTTDAVHTGAYTVSGSAIAGTSAVGVVSVGSVGNERQIQNVAAGVVSATSTDAVNGSQLYAVGSNVNSLGTSTAAALGGGSTYTPGAGVGAPNYVVQGKNYNNVGSAFGAVNSSLTGLNNSVNNVGQQIGELWQSVGSLQKGVQRGYEGSAVAIAHTSPTISRDAKFGVSGKWGNFRGQNALGVMAQARINNNIVLNASVGAGLHYGGVGFGAGGLYEW